MVQTMNYLNLQQSIDYLKERLAISYFDLPQLASLCRIGQVTPFTSFVGIIATDYAPYELETLNGYITSLEFQRLLDTKSLEQLTITTALKFDDLNNTETWQTIYLAIDDKVMGEGFFKDKDRTPYDYACNGFIRYPNGVTITRNDLLFDLEQLDSIAPAKNTAPTDDEPKHPKSVGSMTSLIATLIKMAEYDKADLEQPTGEINKTIVAKAQNLGLKIEKDFVAKWLKNAYEAL